MTAIIPVPKISIDVRDATMGDLPFIDALQKMHSKQVSFLKEQALIGKINLKQVIVAETVGGVADPAGTASATPSTEPVGYVIGSDKYFKHENVGVIYQLNVAPGKQRNLVGATLVKAMFDRAAYGCKLFCLWCAQDIEANRFWESIGFIPIAFRAGSEKRNRLHIFWEKRIREGDTTTPWWYPTETTGGLMGAARLVFPIPPGVRWSDPMPRVLPPEGVAGASPAQIEDKNKQRGRGARDTKVPTLQPPTRRFVQFGAAPASPPPPPPPPPKAAATKAAKVKRPAVKNDPALVAKARELNSRWLEEINSNPTALPAPGGKYHVTKQIESKPAAKLALLEAA